MPKFWRHACIGVSGSVWVRVCPKRKAPYSWRHLAEIQVNQATVLIFADDPEFVQTIIARWQTERCVPKFIVSNSDAWEANPTTAYDAAIVGPLRDDNPVSVLKLIDYRFRPALYVAQRAAQAQAVRSAHPRALVLQDYEGWINAVVLVVSEALRRVEATDRARRAEQTISSTERHAVLGRYMLDVRHRFNNVLTSILGNAELLLLEPRALPPEALEQIATIHNMSMRLHEIMQQFASLDSEMQFAQADSQAENKPGAQRLAQRG